MLTPGEAQGKGSILPEENLVGEAGGWGAASGPVQGVVLQRAMGLMPMQQ